MDRSEFLPQEVSERGEAVESTESRALEEATFEPAACVEGMGEYQQAEAIQASLEMVMASLTTAKVPVGEVSATPQPIPRPEEEVSATPQPIPHPEEEVSGLPVPIPHPKDEVSATPQPIPHPQDEISTLPTPLPHPGDEVSATPQPIPRPEEDVSATPQPIPHPEDEVSATPITLPTPIPQPGEEVSGLPIPIPHPVDEIGAKGTWKGTEGTTEMPLPGTAGEQVGATPINLPREADLASGGGVAGSGAEGVGITPINLPREADMASGGGVAGSGAEGVGITPINLPREANVVSDALEDVMHGSTVASGAGKGPGGEGVAFGVGKGPGGDGVASGMGKGPGGAAEMPLPGTAGEGRTMDSPLDSLEEQLNSIGDDGKLAEINLQDALQKQQQIATMLSNMSKAVQETAQGIIRNMK